MAAASRRLWQAGAAVPGMVAVPVPSSLLWGLDGAVLGQTTADLDPSTVVLGLRLWRRLGGGRSSSSTGASSLGYGAAVVAEGRRVGWRCGGAVAVDGGEDKLDVFGSAWTRGLASSC